MSDESKPCMTGWAVVVPACYSADREVRLHVEIGERVTEGFAWHHALGWPDAGEIARAKRQGARAFRCRVVEVSLVEGQASEG